MKLTKAHSLMTMLLFISKITFRWANSKSIGSKQDEMRPVGTPGEKTGHVDYEKKIPKKQENRV